MKHNKAQFGIIAMVIVVIAVILAIVILSGGVFAKGNIDSLTPVKEGCDVQSQNVRIKGETIVTDTAFVGVIATADDVTITSILSTTTGETIGRQLRAFTKQNYEWKVELINLQTNNVEDSDKGKNIHPGGDFKQRNVYTLDFRIPDNNCDGIIDDWDADLRLIVETDDGEISEVKKLIEFKGGKFTIR